MKDCAQAPLFDVRPLLHVGWEEAAGRNEEFKGLAASERLYST
jgi:hypothetical protein